jgi:hypothetical protein
MRGEQRWTEREREREREESLQELLENHKSVSK